ncbi:hypothetical protein ABDJ41_01700 [Pedobacter sp. ASV1-7]|uniref:hypothetical protein n=1 Tax=Pedobacter sp. ASV1-7 TaxID=3145237 RepID=UPI0032E85335
MKTLANTSPFLLLLVPVFIMILLTFTKVGPNNQTEDVVSKTPATQNGFIKVSIPFSR